ncbi:MAG: AAA family ATPase [Parabacteroides distasonis]|nr:AAA family ATPase [Parabacteroides distasonis]
MSNKYGEILLKNVSLLDKMSNSGGKISKYAIAIVNSQDSLSTVSLYRILYTIVESKKVDEKTLNLVKNIKDNLISFYGYQRVFEICNGVSIKLSNSEEKESSLSELQAELNQLVGLENVKSKVNDLIIFQKVQQLRKNQGLNTSKNTLHLAFTGNPGTGKTTVARIVGRIYKQIGLLSKGHFTEVSRTDLIAGYQGQTAHKVKEVIEKSKGGVLFIDEAYSITENEHSDSYGRECLTELTKALEDYRNDLVVIVAGYTEPMRKFFDSNPGLKSRFNTFIEFDDYNASELYDILLNICKKNDYTLSEIAAEKLKYLLEEKTLNKDENFANGRLVRNIFDDLVMNHARRIVNKLNPSILDLKEIVDGDISLYK